MPFTLGCRPISGLPPISRQRQGRGCTPPTLHDLEGASQMDKGWTPRLSNGQGFDPPNPSRLVPNGQGFDPPNPSRQGFEPPNPSRLWSSSQMDNDWTEEDKGCTPRPAAPKRRRMGPPTLHDLDGSPKGQGWDPHVSQFGAVPQEDKDKTPSNLARFGAAPQKDKDGTLQPFTIWWRFPSGI